MTHNNADTIQMCSAFDTDRTNVQWVICDARITQVQCIYDEDVDQDTMQT